MYTLKELNFAGTKFRGFRGLGILPRNLIPAKRRILVIHKTQSFWAKITRKMKKNDKI